MAKKQNLSWSISLLFISSLPCQRIPAHLRFSQTTICFVLSCQMKTLTMLKKVLKPLMHEQLEVWLVDEVNNCHMTCWNCHWFLSWTPWISTESQKWVADLLTFLIYICVKVSIQQRFCILRNCRFLISKCDLNVKFKHFKRQNFLLNIMCPAAKECSQNRLFFFPL